MVYSTSAGVPVWFFNEDKSLKDTFFSFIKELPSFVKEGDDLNGFSSPINYAGNKRDFFERFGLWENTKGWGVEGIKRVVLNNINSLMIFANPPMVGDWLIANSQKYYFATAKASFDRAYNVWRGVYTFSKNLPTIKEPDSYTNEYFNSINDLLEYIKQYVADYVSGSTGYNGFSILYPSSSSAQQSYDQKLKPVKDNKL